RHCERSEATRILTLRLPRTLRVLAMTREIERLRREALAAPEDVGGEDGERDHEGDPDAVGARQDGQVYAGIDDAEAGVQQIDEKPPPLDQQEPYADEDVQGG